ncbi:MAG: chaperonin GroEL [bacterium]
MAKQIVYSQEAREKLKSGVDKLAKAVVTTLGPKGRNVALDKKWGAPTVTHDGVTVAKEVELADPFENMGAQLVKEAASKTNDVAGDGTTTATLLAQALVDNGLRNVTAGTNPMVLRRGLEKARDAVVSELEKSAKKISTKQEKAAIATISAADSEIGNKIAEALEKVGANGVVTVEESKGLELSVEYKEGMELDKGYASAYFVTNPDTLKAEITNPHILITDQKIASMEEILPLLESLVKVTKDFVIIADDVEGEALATLVVNKLRGTFNAIAIKAPGFGDRRSEMLEDLAILTGGKVISKELGRELKDTQVSDLGQADRVVADKDTSVIVGGKGDKKAIEGRITLLERQIKEADSDWDKEKLQERLAKLAGGVAVINVGAATEVELKEKKHRVEDAVSATRAAVEEGIVPGGGVALLRAAKALDNLNLKGEEKIGADILRAALEMPLRKIVENAGVDAGWVVREIINRSDANFGYDVMELKFGDMVEKGIIDPAKVTKSALQNAVSVSLMVLTTDALVTDEPEKEAPPTPQVPPMGGMGM